MIKEDAPSGDITTRAIFGRKDVSEVAAIVAKQDLVVSGFSCVRALLANEFPRLRMTILKRDGVAVKKGEILAMLKGRVQNLLLAERVVLNILAHLSGIATLTHYFVCLRGENRVKILDTRKTTPGWREWERQSVRHGGGENHRMTLSDQYLIKDNHIAAIGSVTKALKRVYRHQKNHGLKFKVEVEVKDLLSAHEALRFKPDIVMLDNMSVSMIKQVVRLRNKMAKKVKLEISGGVTIKNFKQWLKCGVERISIGSLTHSAPAVDISLIIPRKRI